MAEVGYRSCSLFFVLRRLVLFTPLRWCDFPLNPLLPVYFDLSLLDLPLLIEGYFFSDFSCLPPPPPHWVRVILPLETIPLCV